MLKRLWPVLLLAGCAYQSDTTTVTPVGPGTYAVAGRAGQYAGGSQGGLSLAMQKANAYCQAEGQRATIKSVQPQAGGATVYFICQAP
jgi:hypothetical protein